jgi:hypothetical protein
MGEVEGGMNWQPGPLTTIGGTPGFYDRPHNPIGAIAAGVPPLLARPPEEASPSSTSTPWLLFAGLGLVAYMMFK